MEGKALSGRDRGGRKGCAAWWWGRERTATGTGRTGPGASVRAGSPRCPQGAPAPAARMGKEKGVGEDERGWGARAAAGRPWDQPTCLGEADDLGDALLAVCSRAGVAVEVRDLHAAVFAHLARVQLAQGRDHGGLGHGVRDVGPAPHLQAAQDVPLHRLQEVAVLPLWGLLACCNVSVIIAPGRPLHHYFHPEEGYSINCSRGLLGK